jgi:hypothetical protein
MKVRKIGMRSDDQGLGPANGRKGGKIRDIFSRRRIQDEHMSPPDADLDSGNKEDAPFPGMGRKLPVERDTVMVGDGQDIIPFLRGARNELLGCVPDPVDGVLRGVKMEVHLQGF